MINCRIDRIAAKAIHDIGISRFTFERNTLVRVFLFARPLSKNLFLSLTFRVITIESEAIDFDGGSVSIAHNKLSKLGSNWLKSQQWHKVNVLNNTFGIFDSLQLENPTSENVECTFKKNSFTQVQPDSFKSISGKCQFTELIFKQNCACSFHKWLEKLFLKTIPLKQLQSESFCSLDTNDILLHCLKAETVKYNQYYEEICRGKPKKLKCDRVKVETNDGNFFDSKVLSDDIDWMEYIHYIIGGVACLVIASCLCIVMNVRRKSRNIASDHYAHGTMHRQTDLLQLNQSEGPPSYEASLRSNKIFSNHDHIIIKRTLELMKQKQPKDKYELVYNHTKRLLHEHINEYEKVRIIGDIVQTIGECENSGEDFVAFTDILYKHLAPDTTTTPRTATAARAPTLDDLYAEPRLPQSNATPSKEHIYAEPTVLSQQQTMVPLLLANNYSKPLDNNIGIINNNLYSEPVIHENKVGECFIISIKIIKKIKINTLIPIRIVNFQAEGRHTLRNQPINRSAVYIKEPSRYRK